MNDPLSMEAAKKILDNAVRYELRDHAFGDTEVTWEVDGVEVGGGYFGTTYDVWIGDIGFHGADAKLLRNCGKNLVVERNDETGPDRYTEGVTMPGLTIEGVRNELEGR
jgi:hypothetical protein